jgi:hypothetical protein
MVKERAKVFGDDDDTIDVSEFTPKAGVAKNSPPPEAVRAVSEKANFPSREPATSAKPAASIIEKVKPQPVSAKREPRRHRTGRNVQMNLKVTQRAYDLINQITDEHEGWVLGGTFEYALDALVEKLAREKSGSGEK